MSQHAMSSTQKSFQSHQPQSVPCPVSHNAPVNDGLDESFWLMALLTAVCWASSPSCSPCTIFAFVLSAGLCFQAILPLCLMVPEAAAPCRDTVGCVRFCWGHSRASAPLSLWPLGECFFQPGQVLFPVPVVLQRWGSPCRRSFFQQSSSSSREQVDVVPRVFQISYSSLFYWVLPGTMLSAGE